MKETEELIQYFPDYSQSELPERNYLWTVISSVMPKETKRLIERAREQRGVSKNNMSGLIALTYDLKKEIFDVKAQKSKYSFLVTFSATRGNAVYMLKQSAVLKKKKKSPQAFSTDLETLKIAEKNGKTENRRWEKSKSIHTQRISNDRGRQV